MQGGHKNTIRVLVQASEVEQKSVFHGFMQQTETELAVIVWQICICMQHIWNTKSESNVGIFQLAPSHSYYQCNQCLSPTTVITWLLWQISRNQIFGWSLTSSRVIKLTLDDFLRNQVLVVSQFEGNISDCEGQAQLRLWLNLFFYNYFY